MDRHWCNRLIWPRSSHLFLGVGIVSSNQLPKKNPTFDATPKVIQTKMSLKAKNPQPAKGVVIKEPSPNSGRPTVEEVVGKGEETTQLGSSSGERRLSSNSSARPAKKQKTSFTSDPHWLNCSGTTRRVRRLL
ncbi:Uncharacterized protein Fot_06216 [Forsythia ovata]|uniref:Uncharacterized protein n=1 Tax=Forsythia ovata TaxID=205694 RepID=A0ABD1WSB8_9LAMI